MTEKEYSHDPQIPPAPDPCEHHTKTDIEALFMCEKVGADGVKHRTLALVGAFLALALEGDIRLPKPKPEPEGDDDISDAR